MISEKYFSRFFWITCAISFVVICLRAFCIPFSHDETATFFFYVQSDNYLPYKAHVYTNNHVLNSALTNICWHIAGSHRFILRIPNILSFLLLCYGAHRHFKYLSSVFPKLLLTTFFILTFNFLDFFQLSRGYGLSMALMVAGFSFLMDYFTHRQFKHLLLFSLLLQLALAANLILVVMLVIVFIAVLIFQFRHKLLFRPGTILLQIINLVLLIFWIRFSFFYKDHGSLDYGVGDNYWDVTFKTLMQIVYGTDASWLQIITLLAFLALSIFVIYSLVKQFSFNKIFTPALFYPLLLIALITGFYLQKKILDVNFPEDRTGLFFYVLFSLGLAFFLNALPKPAPAFSLLVFTATFIHFLSSFNLSNFSSFYYHTMPKPLFDQLTTEFEKEKQVITVGGHRVRELNYAFLNYRGQSVLNPMDESEEMQMNCDYYYAMKREEPFYKNFYDVIGVDVKWERVLLKRKEKISRKIFHEQKDRSFKGENEFNEFIRISDTTFTNNNPIELYTEIYFKNVPSPFNAFLVMEVKNDTGNTIWYKRIPLNWLAKDLTGQTKHLKLTTGNLPEKATIVAYLWNIEKQNADVFLKQIKLYQLHGKGVNYRIPAEFYTLNYLITKKPLL